MATLRVGATQPYTSVAAALAVAGPTDIIDIIEDITEAVILNVPVAQITSSTNASWNYTTAVASPILEIQSGMNQDLLISGIRFTRSNPSDTLQGCITISSASATTSIRIVDCLFGSDSTADENVKVLWQATAAFGANTSLLIDRCLFEGDSVVTNNDRFVYVLSAPTANDQIIISNNTFLDPVNTTTACVYLTDAAFDYHFVNNTIRTLNTGSGLAYQFLEATGALGNIIQNNLYFQLSATTSAFTINANLTNFLNNAALNAADYEVGYNVSNILISSVLGTDVQEVSYAPWSSIILTPVVGGSVINAGITTITTHDYRNFPRPFISAYDIGAIEFSYTPVPPYANGRRITSGSGSRIF